MPMKLNQFAVYRVDQQTAGKALWHLPYQEARQQNVSITVENYRLISIHEMQENEKVADIWKRTKNQCEVSDVLVLNKNGEISCYYVDENYPQYLAGFIRINTSGALITMETEIYLLTLLTFPYFQGFPPLKILYMYPFPLFLPLWDNYKGKFIIQLFNRCLPLYQEVLRKSALLPL